MRLKALEPFYYQGQMHQIGDEFEIDSPGSDIMALVALGQLEPVKTRPMTTTENSALTSNAPAQGYSSASAVSDPSVQEATGHAGRK